MDVVMGRPKRKANGRIAYLENGKGKSAQLGELKVAVESGKDGKILCAYRKGLALSAPTLAGPIPVPPNTVLYFLVHHPVSDSFSAFCFLFLCPLLLNSSVSFDHPFVVLVGG
jgi:hypothetical protein